MRTTWARGELAGREVVWILDVTVAGQVQRVATRPVVIDSDDGPLRYAGGLGRVRVTQSAPLFDISAQPPGASLEVLLDLDVPAQAAAGHELSAGRGELSQHRVGDAWEDRRVVVTGRLRTPTHGTAEQAIRFTLRDDPAEDAGELIDPTITAGDDTWYSAQFGGQQGVRLSAGEIGRVLPVIIGRPGYDPEAPSGWITGSEAVWLNKTTNRHALGLAQHPVAATTVWANTDSTPQGQQFTVSTAYDARGRLVSVISDEDAASGASRPLGAHTGLEEGAPFAVPSAYQPAVADDAPVYIGWAYAGGLIGADGREVRGAGDVLEWALARSSVPVDIERVRAVSARLNGYLIDAAIEEPCAPMDWLRDHVLPLLPVSLVMGPSGLYPVVWDPDAEPVADLDADADPKIEIGDAVEEVDDHIRNRFVLRYGLSLRTGTYRHTTVLDAQYEEDFGTGRGNLYDQGSAERYFALRSVASGQAGRVTVTLTAALAEAGPVDSAATNSVAVEYNVGTSTFTTILALLNASTLITATSDVSGATVFGATGHSPSATLVPEDTSTLPHLLCRLSQQQRGTVYTDEYETEVVYDRGTAEAVCIWKARAFALAHRTVAAMAPESEWGWVEVGTVLRLTRSALGFTDVRAVVEEVELGDDGMVGMRLRVIPDPLRDL